MEFLSLRQASFLRNVPSREEKRLYLQATCTFEQAVKLTCILYSTESCLFLQAWLYAKVEAAHQARLKQPDPSIEKQKKVERLKEANTAYTEWLEMKRKQDKALQEVEGRRRADEAAQYAIRDRQLCDEAFRR